MAQQANEYDVIVVGAGIAGLMCANFLVREGKRVLLVEHNHQAGGCMNGIRRKGYYFECGDQSFESMGIMIPLLEELGLYKPEEWERADYRIKTPKFDVETTSMDAIEAAMHKAHPNDPEGIRAYMKDIRRMSDLWSEFTLNHPVPGVRSGLGTNLAAIARSSRAMMRNNMWKQLAEWQMQYAEDFTKQRFNDPELKALFACVAYAGSSTILGGAMFWHLWVNDYWYPRKGLQWFVNMLADNVKKHGGEVKYNRTVDEILVTNGRVKGLRTHKGEVYLAKQVVHCGDYRRLYTKMIPRQYLDPAFVESLEKASMSEPLVSVYLGLNMSHSEMGEYLRNHHTFYFPTYYRKDVWASDNDPDLHKNCFMEITWTSKNNPDLAPRGKTSLVLQTATSYRWNNYWGTGGDDAARPEAYEQCKKLVADQMIDTLSQVIPPVKERVDYVEVGSPQSSIRYTLNAEGASCSWSWDMKKTPFRLPRMRTPVSGLYTAGHYAFWPGGVPTAAMSGKLVADLINNGVFSARGDRIWDSVAGGAETLWEGYSRVQKLLGRDQAA